MDAIDLRHGNEFVALQIPTDKSPDADSYRPLPGGHGVQSYRGGTWLLTCGPWYRWSWSLQAAGKKNWTLSLRTPL